jgi:hypothetical protein
MKVLFGGGIAIVLLFIYLYAMYFATEVALCLGQDGCTALPATDFTEGYVTAITTIGGLLSALVVAVLAINQPGEAPTMRIAGQDLSPGQSKALKYVTMGYLLAWVAAGAAAFVVGVMMHPGELQPLTDVGKTWLGLAVAAVFAYFNITPAPAGQTTRSGSRADAAPKV